MPKPPKRGNGALTLYRLFGQGINDYMKTKQFDTTKFMTIMFDEILLIYKPRQLNSIEMYMEKHKGKSYIPMYWRRQSM